MNGKELLGDPWYNFHMKSHVKNINYRLAVISNALQPFLI